MAHSFRECAADANTSTSGLPSSIAESVSQIMLVDCRRTAIEYSNRYSGNYSGPQANYHSYYERGFSTGSPQDTGQLEVTSLDYGRTVPAPIVDGQTPGQYKENSLAPNAEDSVLESIKALFGFK